MAKVSQRKDRGGAWYAEFRWNGKRYREYAGPPEMKKADAEHFLAKRKVEVARERIYGPKPAPPITFAAFADDFLETDSPDKRSKARDKQVIEMLSGAMAELQLGDPAALATDIGPVIDCNARQMLERHQQRMNEEAKLLARCELEPRHGCAKERSP